VSISQAQPTAQRERKKLTHAQSGDPLPVTISDAVADQTRVALRRLPVPVSIIIAGRNSAAWLVEAIVSALTQSVMCEVIYSDDCSTDGSVELADRFASSGLIVVTAAMHGGVCAARNRGAAAAHGEFLVFLDSDDQLTEFYVADMLAAWSPGVPLVYGSAKAVGGRYDGRHWLPAEFAAWDRWGYNTVNTTSLYHRAAFVAAGGWIDAPTLWDWDLALRVIRFGEPVTSKAVLLYRQHDASWSALLEEKESGCDELREVIRRRNARLTVGTLLSGRIPELLPVWMQSVAMSVRFAELTQPVELVILCDKAAAGMRLDIRREAARWGNVFDSVVVTPIAAPLATDGERSHNVSRFLASAMQQLRDASHGDVLWMVEDDVLVPLAGCRTLWETVTAGVVPVEAASGIYRNRHAPQWLIGGWCEPTAEGPFRYREPTRLHEVAATGSVPIDFTGCGCLMTWLDRPTIPKAWRSHVAGSIAAHDWAYCLDVKRLGGRVVWRPDVRCGHARTVNEIIWPEWVG